MKVFRRNSQPGSAKFDEIIALLSGDQPALVLMTLSDSFYTPNAAGLVAAPAAERPDPTRRHAIIAVAHGTLASERVVLLRNSWGVRWGLNGHAWLRESFLAPRLIRVAKLTGSADVSTH
jgi:hypothetical protein